MKKIIIIPIHNQLTFLQKCVESVYNNTKDFELILVDDGSTDKETSKWIKNQKQTHIITHDKSLGFSKSCNDGIDYTVQNFNFNCLCLLNSDTEIITNNWFDIVENEINNNKNKIGIAGVVSNNAVSQTIYDVDNYMKVINEKPTLYSKLIHGFCFFITKDLIFKIGRFDEDTFPHYGSEDDYALKSIKAGFNNIIVGSVMVKHNAATSYSEETRREHLKYSVPNLLNRWTKKYIDECIKESVIVQKQLNTNN